MDKVGLDSAQIGLSRPGARPRWFPFVKRAVFFLLKTILIIHIAYVALTSLCILAYKFTDPVYTLLMPYRAIGYGWKIQKPVPIPLNRVPAYARSMLVAVEDGKFYSHFGIDFEAFKRAREINERLGKPLYGGSTLTMQVARTLFLVPEKSYLRKYLEVIAALELELILSKERILELYFGYAEWGKGIFGIEAASRHWYGKGAASLTRDQAARLIALLSSPIKYTPSTLDKSGILRERYAYLYRRFVAPREEPPLLPLPAPPPPGAIEPGMDLPGGPTPEAAPPTTTTLEAMQSAASGAPAGAPAAEPFSGTAQSSSTPSTTIAPDANPVQ